MECPDCAAGCVNGTCDAALVCVCDRGWAGDSCNTCAPGFEGDACDQCAANAFGMNCDTCATLSAATPWWDPDYQTRRTLIAYNPAGSPAVLEGVVAQHTFDHAQQNLLGADPGGADVRVVAAPDQEIDRLLGFDSEWVRGDTTIWFPTVASISAGNFQVYHLYVRNPLPDPVMENASAVLRQDRGWFSGPGGPPYSAEALSSGSYSIQLRQKDPQTLQVYFHDSGNNGTASVLLRLTNTVTGTTVVTVPYDGSLGSSAFPADIVTEHTGLPASLRVDVLIDPGADVAAETAAIYLGSQRVQFGTTSMSYQATLSRASNSSAVPSLFECAFETAP